MIEEHIESVYPYVVTMTVGQMRGYDGPQISKEELCKIISVLQKNNLRMSYPACAVKIVESEILFGDYSEKCWDLSVINYPRFPQDRTSIVSFMDELAQTLLKELEQNRITVCYPEEHVMYENRKAFEERIKNED